MMKRTLSLCICLVLLSTPATCWALSWGPPINVGTIEKGIAATGVALSGGDVLYIVAENSSQDYSVAQESTDLDAFKTLSNSAYSAYQPLVAVDDEGNGLAVWLQNEKGIFQAMAARYANGSWGTPSLLSKQDVSVSGLRLSMNGAGEAAVVWKQFEGDFLVIKGCLFANGSWNTPQTLSSATHDSDEPQVAVNDIGDVLVAWVAYGIGEKLIQASVLNNGVWTEPQTLSKKGILASQVKCAFSQLGEGFVVWYQSGTTSSEVYAARLSQGAWGAAQKISTHGVDSEKPTVAINNKGFAVAVWEQYQENPELQAATCTGGVWTASQTISNSKLAVYMPKVALNEAGQAVVVGQAKSLRGDYFIQTVYFDGSQWEGYQNLSVDPLSAFDPFVVLSESGHAYAVWSASSDEEAIIQVSEGQ